MKKPRVEKNIHPDSKSRNPAFPLTRAKAEKALEQMRKRPKPMARPLVIIGGLLDPAILPLIFKDFFGKLIAGNPIIHVGVGTIGSFDECRRKVIAAVEKETPCDDPKWTAEVDVVGLSLGGLVGRYSAAKSNDPSHPRRLRIARLFTIASPMRGAKLARTVAFSDFHRDMIPGSPFLKSLGRSDRQTKYQTISYVHLEDKIVGVINSARPGSHPYWLSNDMLLPAHAAAIVDPRILADIARRLRGEKPFTARSATPPP